MAVPVGSSSSLLSPHCPLPTKKGRPSPCSGPVVYTVTTSRAGHPRGDLPTQPQQVAGPRLCPRRSERLTPPPQPKGRVTALGQARSHMTQKGTLPPRKITAVVTAGKSQALGDTGLEDKLTQSLVDTYTATYPYTCLHTHTHNSCPYTHTPTPHVYLYTR